MDHYDKRFSAEMKQLIIYRNILKDSIVVKAIKTIELTNKEKNREDIDDLYYEFVFELIKIAQKQNLTGDLWKEYLLRLIAFDENPLSLTCEKTAENLGEGLRRAACHDLAILKEFFEFDWTSLCEIANLEDFSLQNSDKTFQADFSNKNYLEKFASLRKAFLKNNAPEEILDELRDFYHSVGCGKLGMYTAFRWEKERGLVGIKYLDPVTFEDLIGYEDQKDILIKNTEVFLKGKVANNVLLFGDRGTGKSSSVKALLNKYSPVGLRLIEIPKHQLLHFNEILEYARGRGQWFIIFIDDLSFEEFETEYKYLKAVIEGGVEVKPDNVLIYATSNRRHLIKESWSDRDKSNGEVHAADTLQEKLSLVDRFGITITYTSPDQDNYLKIIEGLAKKHALNLPVAELREQALKWEMWHNGRSGRTAKQFINYLLGCEA